MTLWRSSPRTPTSTDCSTTSETFCTRRRRSTFRARTWSSRWFANEKKWFYIICLGRNLVGEHEGLPRNQYEQGENGSVGLRYHYCFFVCSIFGMKIKLKLPYFTKEITVTLFDHNSIIQVMFRVTNVGVVTPCITGDLKSVRETQAFLEVLTSALMYKRFVFLQHCLKTITPSFWYLPSFCFSWIFLVLCLIQDPLTFLLALSHSPCLLFSFILFRTLLLKTVFSTTFSSSRL